MSNRVLVPTLLSLLVAAACGRSVDLSHEETVALITHRTLGLGYLEENLLVEAASEFQRVIEMAPDRVLGWANLGLVYLRQGRFEESEVQLRQALRIDSHNADAALLLAKAFELAGRPEQAVSVLQETLAHSPHHIRSLSALIRIRRTLGGAGSEEQLQRLASALVEQSPGNLSARLNLIGISLSNGRAIESVVHIEQIRRQVPELSGEAAILYEQALSHARSGNAEAALSPMVAVHNMLKVTPLYQIGVLELEGRPAQVGFPLLAFARSLPVSLAARDPVLDGLRFVNTTPGSGLDSISVGAGGPTHAQLTVSDFDGDGDDDLIVSSSNGIRLLRNQDGQFVDATTEANLSTDFAARGVAVGDYDNDGHTDLYFVADGFNRLYHGRGDGSFDDVSARARVQGSASSRSAFFADLDHDGDLDLFVANDGPDRLYRNNLDGTFTEVGDRAGLSVTDFRSDAASFADFDDDGDLDLVVAGAEQGSRIYSNIRQGRFETIALATSIAATDELAVQSVGDYDNDGDLDLLAANTSQLVLFRNSGGLSFEVDRLALPVAGGFSPVASIFMDFDNDGRLDVVVAGSHSETAGPSIVFYHNTGAGSFRAIPALSAGQLPPMQSLVASDFDGDGDLDLFAVSNTGRPYLLRNDGGNTRNYLKVRLIGLTGSSGKNNRDGIGARIEVRSGDLFQSATVTQPTMHFGMGERSAADVVRILWSNGVPQNSFLAHSNQIIVEEQVLKGSCGFLYTWDGNGYEFVTDMMWKSALGMPLGIMAGETFYGSARASREYLLIPGELLQQRDGKYSIQITEELWELAYLDEIRLIVLDHPDTTDIFLDERFRPPEIAALELYGVQHRSTPVAAFDDRDNDLLPAIRTKDDVYASDIIPTRYQGITDLHDLVLDLGEDAHDSIALFLNGWLFPTDASINVAISQSREHSIVPPYLQVPDSDGEWQTVMELSFPTGKNKMIIADLSGIFLTDDYRVRIRTNMEVYWDYIFFADARRPENTRTTTLEPQYADLHFRGFSRVFRRGGRYGPHWFDYDDVSTESPWRVIEGSYTRYGNVLPLLDEADDQYVVMQSGDEITIEFDATTVPELPNGWERDFLIYSNAFLKDGDLNTAEGQTVGPLPFHSMSRYPYGSDESYPDDEERRHYLETFNTRLVAR